MANTALLCTQSLQSIPKELYFAQNLHIFLLHAVMTANCIQKNCHEIQKRIKKEYSKSHLEFYGGLI